MSSEADNTIDTDILSRQLVRGRQTAALSSVAADGQPHGSMVLVCCDLMARPVLLISKLAVHTRNVLADPRIALLFENCQGLESPLTGPRLSLAGKLQVTTDVLLQARFLRRHPEAEMYAGFEDFDFYQMNVASAHLVAGFGRIETLDADVYLYAGACNEELAAHEKDILDHMNADHADAVDLYARELAGAGGSGWTMTGLDAEGLDLRLRGDVCRIDFDTPVEKTGEVREKLVSLADLARKSG
jgi:hypothetical protein